jgi:hypothetical protein
VVIAIVLALAFTGCKVVNVDSIADVDAVIAAEALLPEEIAGLEKVYADVLSAYVQGIAAKFADYNSGNPDIVISSEFASFDPFSMKPEYTFCDLDMDGNKELLIGTNGASFRADAGKIDTASSTKIWDAWAIVSGKPVRFPDSETLNDTEQYEFDKPLIWIPFSWKNYGFSDIGDTDADLLKKEDWESAYSEIIQAYTYGFATDYEGYEYENPEIIEQVGAQNILHPLLSTANKYKVVYAFYDIDNNGIKELMLGLKDAAHGKDYLAISSIWTIDKRPIRLIEMYTTTSYGFKISNEGYIMRVGGSATTNFTLYQIDEGSMLNEKIFIEERDGGGYQFSDSIANRSEMARMTQADFEQYVFMDDNSFDWRDIASYSDTREMETLYADILKAYAEGIGGKIDGDIINMPLPSLDPRTMCPKYAFYDLDEDGTKELIIGSQEGLETERNTWMIEVQDDSPRQGYYSVWDVWTFENGKNERFSYYEELFDGEYDYEFARPIQWVEFSWNTYRFSGIEKNGSTDLNEQYGDVLSVYRYNTATRYNGYYNSAEYDFYALYRLGDSAQYTFHDIDGNGIKELIAGHIHSKLPYIRTIWTLVNGQPKCVMNAFRSSHITVEGNIVKDALPDVTEVYKIGEDGFSVTEISSTYVDFKVNENGDIVRIYKLRDSNGMKEISEEEAVRIGESYNFIDADEFEWHSFFE